jgi:hypothetical protein
VLIGFDRFVEVMQTLRKFAQDLPFSRRLLVFDRLLPELSHLRTPDGVDAQIFV